jgi:hypothetical protein
LVSSASDLLRAWWCIKSSFNAVTFQQQQQQSQLEQLPSSLADATRRTKAAVQAELDRLERGYVLVMLVWCCHVRWSGSLFCIAYRYIRHCCHHGEALSLNWWSHDPTFLAISAGWDNFTWTIDGIWDNKTSKKTVEGLDTRL